MNMVVCEGSAVAIASSRLHGVFSNMTSDSRKMSLDCIFTVFREWEE